MININYFSNNRLQFFDLIFYFLNKIKPENKEKITINILTTTDKAEYFNSKKNNYDLNIKVILFQEGMNYTSKLNYCMNLPEPYSIKLDEDCIINNYILDYMIENTSILNNENNLLLSPLLSTTYPSSDLFIEGFLNKEQQDIINNYLKNREMPNGLFGVDYSKLNKCTIEAQKWDYKAYNNALNELETEKKGISPMRISYEAQTTINEFILENYQKIVDKNEYSIFEIDAPYFTNNCFLIKTKLWKHIFDINGGVYDEIPISNYKRASGKKFLFIGNSYSCHSMYNTVYGGQNIWKIGHPDAEKKELEFVEKLSKSIIK